jgi:hypothetical protein
VVRIACNDSDKIIKSVMESKKLHEECRACLGNPKAMESEPAWIRVGMRHLPKDLGDTQRPFRVLACILIWYMLLFLAMSYLIFVSLRQIHVIKGGLCSLC